MDLQLILRRLSPDLVRVLRRFPLAVFFAAAATAVLLVELNSPLQFGDEETLRLFAGLGTGFTLALAGRLFAESRPEAKWAGIVLSYVLPVLAAALFEVRDTTWLSLPTIPAAAVMWLSVSAFTRIGVGTERRNIQDRFWWLNLRAVISGGIAVAASLVLFIGLLAVDRSLDLLFGVSIGDFLTEWVLPVVFFFLAPVYWLAVLPQLDAYDAAALEKPDFLTQAIGFVGLFILTPLLAIYSLILIAYAVQIVVTQTLPVGVLGWLVMYFVVTGAANWLILHPHFVRDSVLSRLYRRTWFWATILPLILFSLGLFVRVNAYGLTPERVLLIGGGVWAVALALFYLLPGGRGDIRLIPGLAALVFLVLSFGPFNPINAPRADQAQRFETALAAAHANGKSGWTPELAARARGALDYLQRDDVGEARLRDILARQGFSVAEGAVASVDFAKLIDLPAESVDAGLISVTRVRQEYAAVSVADTPIFLGEVSARVGGDIEQAGLMLTLENQTLVATGMDPEGVRTRTDLSGWLARQSSDTDISDPAIDFDFEGHRYRLIARLVQIDRQAPDVPAEIIYLSGWLFSDKSE